MILRSELKQNAKNQLKNNWGLAIGIIIVCTLISCIPNLLVEINDESLAIAIITPIITLFITGPLTIGQCRFFINLSNRSNPKFSDLWYGFNNILKAIGVTLVITLLVGVIVFIGVILLIITGIILSFMYPQVYYIMSEGLEMSMMAIEVTLVVRLLVGVIVFIGAILLIITGIILSFMYSQVYYIMAENPEMSIIDCLKESSRIMKGHKMDLFVLELSFLGWVILMGITFGIAGLYVLPYYSATLTNFYLEIKN